MNKKCFKSIFATAALCVLLGACASPTPKGSPSFTLVSSQTDKMKEFYEATGEPIKFQDCNSAVFEGWIAWGIRGHNEEATLVRALDKYNADALLDTKFTTSYFYIPIFYNNFCTTVTGTPVKLKG